MWTGDPQSVDDATFRQVVAPDPQALCLLPPVFWWLEPDMFGQADLLFSYRESQEPPVRVKPGWVVYRDGGNVYAIEGGHVGD